MKEEDEVLTMRHDVKERIKRDKRRLDEKLKRKWETRLKFWRMVRNDG